MVIVLVGYGTDLPIYRLCKKIWELHTISSQAERVLPIFVETDFSQSELVRYEGGMLSVRSNFGSNAENPTRSNWVKEINLEVVFRMQTAFSWILENFAGVRHVYCTTVTSLPELFCLDVLSQMYPTHRTYAGSLCVLNDAFLGIKNFVFASGANTLLSPDCLRIAAEKNPLDLAGFPNDVWLGLRLLDLPRRHIPRYDIERSTADLPPDFDLRQEINNASRAGHFHFRVKSDGAREKSDHLILFDVYRQFLLKEKPSIEKFLSQSLNRSIGASL